MGTYWESNVIHLGQNWELWMSNGRLIEQEGKLPWFWEGTVKGLKGLDGSERPIAFIGWIEDEL